jgi:hypothetical protein
MSEMRIVKCCRCGVDIEVPVLPPQEEWVYAPYVLMDEKFWCSSCTKNPKLNKLESHLLGVLQSPNN